MSNWDIRNLDGGGWDWDGWDWDVRRFDTDVAMTPPPGGAQGVTATSSPWVVSRTTPQGRGLFVGNRGVVVGKYGAENFIVGPGYDLGFDDEDELDDYLGSELSFLPGWTEYTSDGTTVAYGGNVSDWIWGGVNDDTIYGYGGDDDLRGGKGDDIIDGGTGDDVIYGGPGGDILQGGSGDDRFHGNSSGEDDIDGGEGGDTIHCGDDGYRATVRNVETIIGGTGSDVITLTERNTATTFMAGDGDWTYMDAETTNRADPSRMIVNLRNSNAHDFFTLSISNSRWSVPNSAKITSQSVKEKYNIEIIFDPLDTIRIILDGADVILSS